MVYVLWSVKLGLYEIHLQVGVAHVKGVVRRRCVHAVSHGWKAKPVEVADKSSVNFKV